MGRPVINLIGLKFGLLTVNKQQGFKYKSALWLCNCSCGKEVLVSSKHLKSLGVRSCGCLRNKLSAEKLTTHGYTKSGTKQITEYYAWHSMKDRCFRENHPAYKYYGGRGITVCDRWKNSFKNFIEDMGFKSSPKHTLERLDNEKNYSPDNCIWATYTAQNKNRRNNVWLEYNGKRMIAEDWARFIGCTGGNLIIMLRRKKSLENIFKYYEKKGRCFIW